MSITIGPSDTSRIRSAVDSLLNEFHLPGMSVGVVLGDKLVFAEGFGYTDIEARRPQDPSVHQRIGSISKTMLGMCAMALVEEGRLSLDDRVHDRLPDLTLHGPAGELAIRHLMTHTGGIGEAPSMADFTDPWDRALWSDSPDIPGVPDIYPDGILVEVPPDTKWAYANHAFVLLGEIISRIEGVPFEEVLRSRLFKPLGMSDTGCEDAPGGDVATGYHCTPSHDERDILEIQGKDIPDQDTVDGYNIRGKYIYVKARAAGAVQSTILDMAKYASALLGRGGGVVSPTTFDEMVRPHWCPDERLVSQGLTFARAERFGRRTYGHGGGIVGGWNTQLTVIPEDNLAVLVHMNQWSDRFSRIEGRVLQAVLDAPAPTRPALPVDTAMLKAATGVYRPFPGPLTNYRVITSTGRVQVTEQNGGLMLRARRGPWREGVPMLPADPTDPTFFVLDTGEAEPPRVVLVRDESGAVTGIRFDWLVYMAKSDGLEPWVS